MYADYYGLRADPFRMSPDHNFCFRHASFSKAKAYMQYALHREEGFVVVTGGPGTGKTTLIGDLLSEYNQPGFVVARLVGAQLEGDDILRMLGHEFRIPIDVSVKSETLKQLHNYLIDIYKRKRRPLVIIDEAQDLAPKALEELRLLTNLQIDGQPLIQFFLLGQTELRDLIRDPSFEQLHQRIIAACHLKPLKPLETACYAMHRLKGAGWSGNPLFDVSIFPELFNFSQGIPRRINLAFSRLLLHGSLEDKRRLDVDDMRLVIEELREEDLYPGGPITTYEPSDPDFQELQALVRPDKPAVTNISAARVDLSNADVDRQAQKPVPPTLDQPIDFSDKAGLKSEPHEIVSVSPSVEDQNDRIIVRVAEKKNDKNPKVVSSGKLLRDEANHISPDPAANQHHRKVKKKDIKNIHNRKSRSPLQPTYSHKSRNKIVVGLLAGLLLTGGALLTAPTQQLNKVIADTTLSRLGVNQVRGAIFRLSGGNLPMRYESKLQKQTDPKGEIISIARHKTI